MTLLEYGLLAVSSLAVVVDPIAVAPTFLAMTPNDSRAGRLRMARIACGVAAVILMGFALAGPWVFHLLGITLPAFQIAGSLLLLRIALDMLYGQRSGAYETIEEVEAGARKEDIAITPLAVPMLAGPGAISTTLILLHRAQDLPQRALLFAAIVAVCLLSYFVLWLVARGAQWLSPLGVKLVTRLSGLLLAAVAVQFAIDGVTQIRWR